MSSQLDIGTPTYHKNSNIITSVNRGVLYNNYVVNQDVLITCLSLGFNDNASWNVKAIPFIYAQNIFSQKGKLKEFIVYNSDQTTNKTEIENNINSFYNIY